MFSKLHPVPPHQRDKVHDCSLIFILTYQGLAADKSIQKSTGQNRPFRLYDVHVTTDLQKEVVAGQRVRVYEVTN
jgi:hypothetical protein